MIHFNGTVVKISAGSVFCFKMAMNIWLGKNYFIDTFYVYE